MKLIDPRSTADAVPTHTPSEIVYDRIDPKDAPCASIKVFYRPRGGFFSCLSCNLAKALPDLLMAQGVIIEHDVGAEISGESEVNDRKRVREDESPGPSKRRTRPTIKKVEFGSRVRQIQALQQALQVSRAIYSNGT